MGKPGNVGLRRIVNATLFSLAGLRAAWQHEAAFRQELMLAVVLIPAGIWLGRTAVERSLLMVKGAVPGAKNGQVVVKPAVKVAAKKGA